MEAAIEKYKTADNGLATIVRDGDKFVDTADDRNAVSNSRLLELLGGSGHVKNGKWDFCQTVTVTLDASGSDDADGDDLVYEWKVENHESRVDPMFNSTHPVSHAVINDRTFKDRQYQFTLLVNDLEQDSRDDVLLTATLVPDKNVVPTLCDLPR